MYLTVVYLTVYYELLYDVIFLLAFVMCASIYWTIIVYCDCHCSLLCAAFHVCMCDLSSAFQKKTCDIFGGAFRTLLN
jgi:hypothetical protein